MPENPPEAQETASESPEGRTSVGTPEKPGETRTEPQATFSADYVKSLREENAKYRLKAKQADNLARVLVTEYARGTGKLVDASDLSYSDELLDVDGNPDAEKVRDAVDALIASKPHLAAIRPIGDVGQGTQHAETMPGLASILRTGAR
jgi:hypothetical protein